MTKNLVILLALLSFSAMAEDHEVAPGSNSGRQVEDKPVSRELPEKELPVVEKETKDSNDVAKDAKVETTTTENATSTTAEHPTEQAAEKNKAVAASSTFKDISETKKSEQWTEAHTPNDMVETLRALEQFNTLTDSHVGEVID